jgi:hypothetical protein
MRVEYTGTITFGGEEFVVNPSAASQVLKCRPLYYSTPLYSM